MELSATASAHQQGQAPGKAKLNTASRTADRMCSLRCLHRSAREQCALLWETAIPRISRLSVKGYP
jgi:hypothetical protein